MKKKIFLIAMMVAMLVCVFAISASAELIPLDSDPGLDCDQSLVSTLDYDAFNNSTMADKESRIIMYDGAKYYVFPAYYIISNSSTYNYSFTNINAAIKAEKGIDYDTFSSMKTQLVRVQLPTCVTNINSPKFENHSILKEVSFTESLKTITSQDAFGGCTALEKISTIEHMTSLNVATFVGCNNLEVDIVWPSAQTSIPSRIFQNCYKIKSVTIPEGVTSVGEKAFQGCRAVKEFIFPNTLESVGKHAIGSCTSLVTVNFGAGFKQFRSGNYDFETTQGDTNLKYVYLPSGLDLSPVTAVNGRHVFGAGTNVTFFFTGGYNEAETIRSTFETVGNNAVIAGATLVAYDPTVDYTTYATTQGMNIIVYDYNACDAFYNGVHVEEVEDNNPCVVTDCKNCNYVNKYVGGNAESGTHTFTHSYAYANGYTQNGTETMTCANAGCIYCADNEPKVVVLAPIFKNFQYSVREDDKFGIVMEYDIDTEALAIYEAGIKASVNYGVVAIAEHKYNSEKDLVKVDGTTEQTNIILANVSGKGSQTVSLIINGAESQWNQYKETPFYILGYAINAGTVEYFKNTSKNNFADLDTISYSQAKEAVA